MGTRSRPGWVVLLAAVGLIAIVALTSRSGLVTPGFGLPDGSSSPGGLGEPGSGVDPPAASAGL